MSEVTEILKAWKEQSEEQARRFEQQQQCYEEEKRLQ